MTNQPLSSNEIELTLLNLTISEIVTDPSLEKAKNEVRNLLLAIKQQNIAITASQLMEKIDEIKAKYKSPFGNQR